MLMREFTGFIIRNSWWAKLKDRIRSFAADYSIKLKLDRQTAFEGYITEDEIRQALKIVGSNKTPRIDPYEAYLRILHIFSTCL